MENSQSILTPLAQAARNLAGSMQRAFAPQLEALRDGSDGLARSDIVDAAARFLDTASETMRSATDAAQDAAKPYQKPARRILETAQNQLSTLGSATQVAAKQYRKPARQILDTAQDQLYALAKSLDTGTRALSRRSQRSDNLITRHPYAATMVVAGVGYLIYRQFHNSHASHRRVEHDREPSAQGTEADHTHD